MPKVTNERLGLFLRINKKIATLNEQRAAIRKDIIATGALSTRDYVAEVETLKKQKLAGKKKFADLLGEGYLRKNKLLTTYVSQEVNVVRKSEHIHNIKRTAKA